MSPVPRLTARRMPSSVRCNCSPVMLRSIRCTPRGKNGEKVVEVVRDAASELTDRFHLLCLPKRFFCAFQPLLVVHRSRHVVDELIGANAVAVSIAQAC